MVTVAVPGGTGKLGLAIVEQLHANPKYTVIVLSRNQPEGIFPVDVPVLSVDYGDTAALLNILESRAVHTVISTMQVATPASGEAEISLVEAASKSTSTKRFISSDWSAPTPKSEKLRLPYHATRLQTLAKLRTTNLEWTTVHNGQIMDYLGTPHIKSYMGEYSLHIDVANRFAAIPGSGDYLMSFSYSFDIAKFVEAALDLPQWKESMCCYSDVRTYSDVLRIAEEQRGSKFTVVHDPVELLRKGQMTELPSHVSRYAVVPKTVLQARVAMFGLYGVEGLMHLPEDETLNALFPDIRTMSVGDILGAWKGK